MTRQPIRTNPMAETLRAIQALACDPSDTRRYADFCRDVVYGATIEYAVCMPTPGELSERLR